MACAAAHTIWPGAYRLPGLDVGNGVPQRGEPLSVQNEASLVDRDRVHAPEVAHVQCDCLPTEAQHVGERFMGDAGGDPRFSSPRADTLRHCQEVGSKTLAWVADRHAPELVLPALEALADHVEQIRSRARIGCDDPIQQDQTQSENAGVLDRLAEMAPEAKYRQQTVEVARFDKFEDQAVAVHGEIEYAQATREHEVQVGDIGVRTDDGVSRPIVPNLNVFHDRRQGFAIRAQEECVVKPAAIWETRVHPVPHRLRARAQAHLPEMSSTCVPPRENVN